MRFIILSISLVILSCAAYAQVSADFSGANGGSVIVGYDSRSCDGSIEGAIRYQSSSNAMQVCKPAGAASPANCPTIGDQCDDDSYYIGDIGAGDIYATDSTHQSSTENWNNGTTNWTTTGVTSATDGQANTAALVALSDAGAPYEAAEYCDGLSAHGHDDWYLPAPDELFLFWNGGSPLAGVSTGGEGYWSSAESDSSSAEVRRFDDGLSDGYDKNFTAFTRTRCIRQVSGGGFGWTNWGE